MEEHQNKPNITILTEVDYKYIIIEIIRSSSMVILFIIANILIFGEELKKAHFNKTPINEYNGHYYILENDIVNALLTAGE